MPEKRDDEVLNEYRQEIGKLDNHVGHDKVKAYKKLAAKLKKLPNNSVKDQLTRDLTMKMYPSRRPSPKPPPPFT